MTHQKVGPRQLLRVETEICGLVSLFTLFSSDETSEGQLLLDFDDFIEGGKETHRKTMEGFYDKYRCGKAVDIMSAGQEGTRFAGRRVVQNPIFASLCRSTNMSSPSSVPLKFQEDTCQTPKESMVVWVGWRQREDQTWRRLTQAFHLGMIDDRRN